VAQDDGRFLVRSVRVGQTRGADYRLTFESSSTSGFSTRPSSLARSIAALRDETPSFR